MPSQGYPARCLSLCPILPLANTSANHTSRREAPSRPHEHLRHLDTAGALRERAVSRYRIRTGLHTLGPHLPEDALLELRPAAEELLVGRGRHLAPVLEGRKLDSADVVGRLREAVVCSRRRPVGNRVLGEGVVDGLVQRASYGLLAPLSGNSSLMRPEIWRGDHPLRSPAAT